MFIISVYIKYNTYSNVNYFRKDVVHFVINEPVGTRNFISAKVKHIINHKNQIADSFPSTYFLVW